MNIVYATDENYAFLTGISIISLFENNREETIDIYLISDRITKKNKNLLQGIAKKYNQKIYIIEQPDLEDISGIKIEIADWSLASFSRLFLSDLLPQHVDRVIWLDCDTIVMNSLSGLWKTDMGDKATGAILDCSSYFKRKQGFTENDYYFNAGVLLINLKLWRKQEIEQKLVQTLVKMGGVSIDVDQGIINKTL